MDKQTTDHRLETRDRRRLSVIGLQSAVYCLAMMAFHPSLSHATTTTTKTSSKSSSTATTKVSGKSASVTTSAKTTATVTMTPLERALAAGKAASKRSLSSRETVKEAAVEASPAVTAAPSQESLEFQKKMADLSQGMLPQDRLIEAPVVKLASKKAAAEEAAPKPDEPKPVKKEITGRVTGINAQGLAVEYAQDKDSGGKEFWIDFDRKVKKAGGLKETAELDVGDKVSAVYNEYPNKSKRLIQVKLLKKKPAEAEES